MRDSVNRKFLEQVMELECESLDANGTFIPAELPKDWAVVNDKLQVNSISCSLLLWRASGASTLMLNVLPPTGTCSDDLWAYK